jgi:hypothetical protein
MVAIYVRTFPFDPEKERENFQRKQAEYEAAWRHTRDPLVVKEAILHAHAARQHLPDWLARAVGVDNVILSGRAKEITERFRERMRHVQRYRCVRDLRGKGHTKTQALNLAVEVLEAKEGEGAWPTIEKSYDKVDRDLRRKGHESEYFQLVARADPTRVPVTVQRGPDDKVIVNGVPMAVAREPHRGRS